MTRSHLLRFEKSFTQQEAIEESTIERVAEILRTGRLHRYNTLPGEMSEAALLEQDYADYQGSQYCLATTSGGQAIQIALRVCGVRPGTPVLANSYTLAPVPGAIFSTGGRPILVDIDDNWHTDLADLRRKAEASGARHFLLSHMRGHIADMDGILAICEEFGITLIEDCAHTMGARWKGTRSGNFGKVACFSGQTYKHMNSGEGGLLTTDDPHLAARAVIESGSYMLYGSHGAAPSEEIFREIRRDEPNCSARLDNIRAALLRDQLPTLEERIARWNMRYRILESAFRESAAIGVVERQQHEEFVGSSIQFHVKELDPAGFPAFIKGCAERGVDVKWFGAAEPHGFTSRYDSWDYLDERADLPQTLRVLSTTCDIRIPLTFEEQDCRDVAQIVCEEAARSVRASAG